MIPATEISWMHLSCPPDGEQARTDALYVPMQEMPSAFLLPVDGGRIWLHALQPNNGNNELPKRNDVSYEKTLQGFDDL